MLKGDWILSKSISVRSSFHAKKTDKKKLIRGFCFLLPSRDSICIRKYISQKRKYNLIWKELEEVIIIDHNIYYLSNT